MKRCCTPLLFLLTALNTVSAQAPFTYNGQQLVTDSHTWLVRPDAPTDNSDEWLFSSARAALAAADSVQRIAPKGTFTEARPLTIYLAPSVYWLDDPDDPAVRRPLPGEGIPYGMELQLSHFRLIGLSNNPTHTVLACNRGQTQGAVGNFTMLHLEGDDLRFENLTFGNYCNMDLVYLPDTTLNRPRRADAIVQAQLAICRGDRVAAHNCHFISRLNSCPLVGAHRTFFENCYFECTDDALCGTGIHHRCRFTLFSGKPFYSTAGTGAVFLDCDLHTLTDGKQYLVKAGSPVAMVDCRWTCAHPDLHICWTQDPTDDLRSYQYNLTQDGRQLFIDSLRPHLTVDMTGKPLLESYRLNLPKRFFTPDAEGDTVVYNLYNLTCGNDGWNPANQPQPMKQYSGKPVALALNRRRATIEAEVDTLRLQAVSLGFMGGMKTYSKGLSVNHSRILHYVDSEGKTDGQYLFIGKNESEEPQTNVITFTDSTGLEAACVVTVLPRQLPAPTFTAQPVINRRGDSLTVHYALDLQGHADRSLITWYRATRADGSDAVPIAVTRGNSPLHTYQLTPADHGHYLFATVQPKHTRSPLGEPLRAATPKPVRLKGKHRTESFVTDFRTFPTDRQPRLIPGHWTVDAYKPDDTREHEWEADTLRAPWHYGTGVDGAKTVCGLIQSVRGARLRFTPLEGEYGDMTLTLDLSPCKTAGQGFGSATGQYFDLGLKMDTHRLNGYALRIIRTVKHDKAVDFQLMQYREGTAFPISEAVSAICYRTGCRVRLQVQGDTLTATVTNRHPLPAPHRPGLATEVHLSIPIERTSYGGILLQHTGSTGTSATVVERMEVEYK